MAERVDFSPRSRADRTTIADVLMAVGIVALAVAFLVAAAVTGLNRDAPPTTTGAEWRTP